MTAHLRQGDGGQAAREAVVLPVLFLSVVLAGGLRPGAAPLLPAPSLFPLVLSLLLVGVLVQSGAFDPRRVINSGRSFLANANGCVLLAAVFVAGAQTFAMLTPESGLPRIVFSVYFLLLMLNTIAAGPDRVRVLRSLGVTFGAALILKFIVLDAVSDPAGGRLARMLQLLLEGVTLGTITQTPLHPAAGYLALVTLVVFLAGIWMLPPQAPATGTRRLRA